MGDDEIAVRVTAQINGLVDGMGEATRTIQTSTQQMGANLESLATKSEGASIGFGRLERSLAGAAISASGADPHLGHIAAIIGSMALDGPIIVGALAAFYAVSEAYDHIGSSAREAAKEQDKVIEKLLEAARLREAGGEGAFKVQTAVARLETLGQEARALQDLLAHTGMQDEGDMAARAVWENELAENTKETAKAQIALNEALAEEGQHRQELRDLAKSKSDAVAKRGAAEERREFEDLISRGLALAKSEIAKGAADQKEIDKWQAQWNKAIGKVMAETRALPGEMGALVNKETETDLITAQIKLQKVLDQTQRSIETVIHGVMAVADAAFARWVTGAATIGQTFSELSRQILLSMIHSIERAFEVWLATEIMKRTIGAKTAKQSILHDAYGAAASAFHSTAGIPFVGPLLAPLAAAAAFAAVAAFGSGIASAAGGYDIPAGVNPMTQLHAREMVLPASLADGLRGLIAGGGGGGGVTVYAMDAQSFRDYLHTNRDSLVPALRTLARNGAL